MKKHLSTIFLVLIFLVGLAVLLYPSISDIYNNTLHQSAISSYENQVSIYTPEDYDEFWKAVDTYNQKIASYGGIMSLINGSPVDEEYKELLSIGGGSAVIAYIEIPSISVNLPVYHGTSEAVLSAGVGHIEGSSMLGGGKGTHAVLSGHRGLPSARLFTDLDKLEKGDIFYIHVLNRTLTYMVDDVSVVLPYEVENIRIDSEKDYVTLITCTPYGINSHRLLIRGVRVDTDAGFDGSSVYTFHVSKDADLFNVGEIAPIAAVPLLVAVLIYVLIRYRNKKTS